MSDLRVERPDAIELAKEANKILAYRLEQQKVKILLEQARLEKYQNTQRIYQLQEIQQQIENFYKGKGPVDFFI